ncbi:MAG: DoxX family protein [Patescibacteria group bacterium]
MNLGNFKINKIISEPEDVLRIGLALIFLTAGIYRVFNPEAAIQEFSALKLPIFLSGLTVFGEIGFGALLLVNKFVKYIWFILIAFLIFVLSWAIVISGGKVFLGAGDLFVFNSNPTDWFLHFVFLVVMIFLLIKKK